MKSTASEPGLRGIYSRDNLPEKIHKLETGGGGGSHWICYRNVDKQYCEYFDPFGLIMPNEIKNYLKTSGKKWCTHQMKYKKGTVFCAVIGAYITFWRDKKGNHY